MSKMFEDRGMMEHLICSVSRLNCKLTDYLLFVRYKKLSLSQIYFQTDNTWYIHRVNWGSIKKLKRKKIKLKPTYFVFVAPIVKN